jgi:hypothetical protein
MESLEMNTAYYGLVNWSQTISRVNTSRYIQNTNKVKKIHKSKGDGDAQSYMENKREQRKYEAGRNNLRKQI